MRERFLKGELPFIGDEQNVRGETGGRLPGDARGAAAGLSGNDSAVASGLSGDAPGAAAGFSGNDSAVASGLSGDAPGAAAGFSGNDSASASGFSRDDSEFAAGLPGRGSEAEDEEDDGRTIAPMNLEGMPWYIPGSGLREGADLRKKGRTGNGSGLSEQPKITDEEMRTYTWAAIRAGLLVAGVFGLVFFLFLLFCDFIWFR